MHCNLVALLFALACLQARRTKNERRDRWIDRVADVDETYLAKPSRSQSTAGCASRCQHITIARSESDLPACGCRGAPPTAQLITPLASLPDPAGI